MKTDILLKAIFKTLLVWLGYGLCAVGFGAVIIEVVRFITKFIISTQLSVVVAIPFVFIILVLFVYNVKYIYKGMLK